MLLGGAQKEIWAGEGDCIGVWGIWVCLPILQGGPLNRASLLELDLSLALQQLVLA